MYSQHCSGQLYIITLDITIATLVCLCPQSVERQNEY